MEREGRREKRNGKETKLRRKRFRVGREGRKGRRLEDERKGEGDCEVNGELVKISHQMPLTFNNFSALSTC